MSKTSTKATKKKVARRVRYTNALGETRLVTPAQKKAWEAKSKEAAKKRQANHYVHSMQDSGERQTVCPDGRVIVYGERTALEVAKGRLEHTRWLRTQKWWPELDSPETRARQIAWVREPLVTEGSPHE